MKSIVFHGSPGLKIVHKNGWTLLTCSTFFVELEEMCRLSCRRWRLENCGQNPFLYIARISRNRSKILIFFLTLSEVLIDSSTAEYEQTYKPTSLARLIHRHKYYFSNQAKLMIYRQSKLILRFTLASANTKRCGLIDWRFWWS